MSVPLPPDPVHPLREGMLAMLVLYREARAAGWPLLAACAYCACIACLGDAEDHRDAP